MHCVGMADDPKTFLKDAEEADASAARLPTTM
jgi:hypothetical protein